MKREEEIKLQILREACDVKEGTGLAWHKDRVANEVAVELIDDGLVLGSVSEYGTACITGIRDAGRDYLDEQKPHKKALAAGRRVLFVLYSIALLAVGYIMNLDSVKTFFSDLIGKVLK
ncbi:MAG: hypothetical protein KJ626_06030 [Verrucomicrobia bacterium]|nr:hypothetical protein [Verrucomicrobiota bacterium]